MDSRVASALLALLLAAAAGCQEATPPPAAPGAPVVVAVPPAAGAAPPAASATPTAEAGKGAAAYTFDGIQIGSRFQSEVMPRPPYSTPCDIDPLDNPPGRIVVYGAKKCREQRFPEDTSVVFYLRGGKDEDRDLDVPIETIIWMGGGYFAERSDFPLQTGEPSTRATEVLGRPVRSFRIGEEERTLEVSTFGAGDVHAIAAGGKLVGFVVGRMPESTENERWEGLLQLYYRFTVGRGDR